MPANRTIFLVDDDEAVCLALSVFLKGSGYDVRSFHSAEVFLKEVDCTVQGVMLLDQRMSGMSGLELQEVLARRGADLSIIFISGHGDVQMSVKAIRAGAINFLVKPFSNTELLASVREAFVYVDSNKKQHDQIAELRERYASISDREREVLKHVVSGVLNKAQAELLGVSHRTIEAHRARVMKKMGAKSLPNLVQKYDMCKKAGLL